MIAATACIHLDGSQLASTADLATRRDLRFATQVDLIELAAVTALAASGASLTAETAYFMANSKNLAAGLLAEGLSAHQPSSTAAELQARIAANVPPFFPIASLPNLDLYLAAKRFGLAGANDHFTCTPWGDAAAVCAAWDCLFIGEARDVIVVNGYAPWQAEARFVLEGHSADFGGAWATAISLCVTDEGTPAASPFLSTSVDPELRVRAAVEWLEQLAPASRSIGAGARALDAFARVGISAADVDAQCGLLGLAADNWADSQSGITLLLDSGFAMSGLAVGLQ